MAISMEIPMMRPAIHRRRLISLGVWARGAPPAAVPSARGSSATIAGDGGSQPGRVPLAPFRPGLDLRGKLCGLAGCGSMRILCRNRRQRSLHSCDSVRASRMRAALPLSWRR